MDIDTRPFQPMMIPIGLKAAHAEVLKINTSDCSRTVFIDKKLFFKNISNFVLHKSLISFKLKIKNQQVIWLAHCFQCEPKLLSL